MKQEIVSFMEIRPNTALMDIFKTEDKLLDLGRTSQLPFHIIVKWPVETVESC